MKSRFSVYMVLLLIGLSMAVLGLDKNAVAANNTPLNELDRQIPFALAIRGGVSLGSYESGFNWAVLQYMKRHWQAGKSGTGNYIDLRTTTGASAGSINALISTITWCLDDNNVNASKLFSNTVNDNLLRSTWLGIGFEELLPKDISSLQHYRADDGVLTRNAFRQTISEIENLLASNVFRAECEVKLGILVSRVEPVQKNIAGVQVHNQRFMIPLKLRVDPTGHAQFVTCPVDSKAAEFGNVMYLQGAKTSDPDCPIVHETQAIIDAIEASSAFPVAFGRKHLKYCEPLPDGGNSMPGTSQRCPNGSRPVVEEFIDGGLFDNIPLGAAKALAEPREHDAMLRSEWEATGRRFNYIYLDPTIRRARRDNTGQGDASEKVKHGVEEEKPVKTTYGLRSQLKFLAGAVHSGRDYELYNVLRGGEWTSQVFAYTDELTRAIRAHFPDITLTHLDLDRIEFLRDECSRLYARDWSKKSRPDPDLVKQASHCLAENAYFLELQYRGIPFKQQLATSKEITHLRNRLIDWIVKLAGFIGEEKLAFAAEHAKGDKLGDRRILMSSRFSPVIGEMMEAFGGFVDRSFREYDYYAGIYDAVWGIANFICERQLDLEACMPSLIRDIYQTLHINESAKADTVFFYLLKREFKQDGIWEPGFSWVSQSNTRADDKNMLAIANSLLSEPVANGESYYQAPSMTAFIRNLLSQEYDTSDSSDFLQRIFRLKDEDELTWYYPLTLRASNRLLYLEKEESEVLGGGDIYTQGLTLGAFFLHSYMQEEEITLNVSTAPDFSWQAWLPDEIGVDVNNGGIDFSWYQGLKIGNEGWRWDVKLTPVQLSEFRDDHDEGVWFSQADLFVSYKTHGTLSAIGVAPSWSWTWEKWEGAQQSNLGAAMYVGFVEDKIRLTIGQMSLRDEFAGDNTYINISVNDVPGLVYWGFPEWRGSWWPSKAKW